MKYSICLLLMIGLFACEPDGAGNSSNAQSNVGSKTATEPLKKVDPNVLGPIVGRWESTASGGMQSLEEKDNYTQIWFELNLDQTFNFGQYEEKIENGTYTFDSETKLLDFNFEGGQQKVASQYKLQGVGAYDGSTVIWLGNTPKNPVGMQIKMSKKMQ